MRPALVVNPVAAGAAGDLFDALDRRLARHGHPPATRYATTERDPGTAATRRALAAGADLVLCCGGDGTLMAVATALAGSGVPLGVLPGGTGNLLARNLDLPQDPELALEVALGDGRRVIDLGRVGDQRFVAMAGTGLDADMVAGTPAALKHRVGWAAYLLGLATHLHRRAFGVRVRLDGGPWRRHRVRALVVGNVGRLQGGVPLLPEARPDDGVLDVVLVAPRGALDWARLAARLLARRPAQDRRIRRFRARRIEVRTRRPREWEHDGDLTGRRSRTVVEVDPRALTVKVPA